MEQIKSHLDIGIEAFKSGDVARAIQELEAATKEDPANYRAYNFLGAAYAAKERYNAAIGAFKHAEQINPSLASIHYNIGQAYEASGMPEEAVFEYEQALRLDSSYSKAAQALQTLLVRLRSES